MIAAMVHQFGEPRLRSFDIETNPEEMVRIRGSQKQGRNHDVTLYVSKGDRIVVIAKPMYPPNLYRAPSGGLKPGEDFHSGITREMAEEIGCEISIRKFLIRTSVHFKCGRDEIFWRSFLFLADYRRGDFDYTDHAEISAVHLATWEDFESYGRIMRQSDIGGLHYRAALHDAVAELVKQSDE